jgi:ABC-type molybdenum transport system ATPase subunit/photorepair protein PhrA
MEKIKELILLRGLPGAGKTTFANVVCSEYVRCEADDYFIDEETGEYKFNQRDLPKAHNWCQWRVESYMQDNHMNDQFYERIVVSNTFTSEWEMKPYYELALKYGYRVHSLIVENRHGNKSVHNVPDATMGNMLNRFEIKL